MLGSLLSVLLVGSQPAAPAADGIATFWVRQNKAFYVVKDGPRLRGSLLARGVRTGLDIERDDGFWSGTLARYELSARVEDSELVVELEPIVDESPTAALFPTSLWSMKYRFRLERRDDGSVRVRGWTGMRDGTRLEAVLSEAGTHLTSEWIQVSTERSADFVRAYSDTFPTPKFGRAGDHPASEWIRASTERLVDLVLDDSGQFRGITRKTVSSSGAIPFESAVMLSAEGELSPAMLLERDPTLFAIVYVLLPTLTAES